MDISSGAGYPASAVSNFPAHPFILDGVEIASMEGFLQSLKYKDPLMQAEVCKLVGRKAKFKGKNKNWWREGILYWRGQPYSRFHQEYQDLLDRAYEALYTQNGPARRALIATGNAVLTHSIGKSDPKKTILTTAEFCGRLMRIRERITKGEL